MNLSRLFLFLSLACIPYAFARKTPSLASQIVAAKKAGASKEELANLKKKLRDEISLAKAAGVSVDTIKSAEARGATLDQISAKVLESKLEQRKKRGVFRKKEVSLASVLFPGASPNEYNLGETLPVVLQNVNSMKTNVPFDYYKIPGSNQCIPSDTKLKGTKKKNFGERLMGKGKDQRSPFDFTLGKSGQCIDICTANLNVKDVRR